MSFFDNLFGDPVDSTVALETEPPAGTYIRAELEGENALCGWTESANREWLALYTCDPPQRVALLRGEEGQFMYELGPPDSMAVSDTGRLAVVTGDDQDTFYVFDTAGDPLVQRPYDEPLLDGTISADGQYSAVVTDGGRIELLDVTADERLGTTTTPATVTIPSLGFGTVGGDPVVTISDDERDELVESVRIKRIQESNKPN